MATYAIGDLQGCFKTLTALLRTIGYDAGKDRLWLAGDLVNRGPGSLEVLRWAKAQGDAVVAVLGNHDLHLLARAAGLSQPKRRDTLDAVLAAPDRDELLRWLAQRPLLHDDGAWAMAHAGLHPHWRLADARREARAVESVLRTNGIGPLLTARESGVGASLRVLTAIRFVGRNGTPDYGSSDAPEEAHPGLVPWFTVREKVAAEAGEPTVIFGHWSTLGYRRMPGAVCLDTGCVWGSTLTALRLDDGKVFSERNAE